MVDIIRTASERDARLRKAEAKIDQIVDVLEGGDHGLFCNSHYAKPCTCWHARISKIVEYEAD